MADASIPVPGSVGAAVDITPSGEFKGTWLEYAHSWIVTVDHKRIGILYIGLGLFFLLVAGIEALLIRIQLIRPLSNFVSPDSYNRLFTLHGTTMVFLVGMPILFGF